jgi:hypothetical protein
MPRRRVVLRRRVEEIIASARYLLEELDSNPARDKLELRDRVRHLIALSYDVRELALHHLKTMTPAPSASTRILEYLRIFVGEAVEGEELDIVSGISEYPRRIREWRVEYGWPIRTEGDRYILEADTPTRADSDASRQ